MGHNPRFLERDVLTRLLWGMIPETRCFCPKGLGVVQYELSGPNQLARATLTQLDDYDVVLWEKHGLVSVSRTVGEAFDMVDTLSNSALIYVAARNMGFELAGMSARQMNDLKVTFNLDGPTLPEEEEAPRQGRPQAEEEGAPSAE
jgi:rhamnulose-1-phosphate aldolase